MIITENIKKKVDIPNDTIKVEIKSKTVLEGMKIGVITPIENQATEMFPKTSEILIN